MTGRLVLAALGIVVLGACSLGRAVELPTAGRVVMLSSRDGTPVLAPVPDALVLVQRMNVCDGSLLGEASTTAIDAYLVRTESTGRFRVPPGTITNRCSRVVLVAEAFVPGYASETGYGAQLAPAAAALPPNLTVAESDVVLRAQPADSARAWTLAEVLYSAFTGSRVTTSMRHEVLREMRPEIARLPLDWAAACARWSVCD